MGQVHCIFWERIKKKEKAREQEMCMVLSEYSLIVVNVYESNDIFNGIKNLIM